MDKSTVFTDDQAAKIIPFLKKECDDYKTYLLTKLPAGFENNPAKISTGPTDESFRETMFYASQLRIVMFLQKELANKNKKTSENVSAFMSAIHNYKDALYKKFKTDSHGKRFLQSINQFISDEREKLDRKGKQFPTHEHTTFSNQQQKFHEGTRPHPPNLTQRKRGRS